VSHNEGKPDSLTASGTIERFPKWLRCNGSQVLRIDEKGLGMNPVFGSRTSVSEIA